MAKYTQTIRRQKLTYCLSVSDHFAGLALEVLTFDEVFNLSGRSHRVI